MDEKKAIEVVKSLVSSIQGAPFPQQINEELYTIWYEHSMRIANEALGFVNQYDQPNQDADKVADQVE